MTLLLLVDYYFWYIEVIKTPITTSAGVINGFKSIFARHGVPEVLITDNGPQFYSGTFSSFAMDYDFRHVTSSPYFAQSNGEAERAVKTVKGLLKKNADPYRALLAYTESHHCITDHRQQNSWWAGLHETEVGIPIVMFLWAKMGSQKRKKVRQD